MKVTIISPAASLSMELSEDMDVGTVGILVSAEIGVEAATLSFHGATLRDAAKTLQEYGVRSGDTIYTGDPPADPERPRMVQLLTQYQNDPYQMSILKQNNPDIHEVVANNDLDGFAEIMLSINNRKRDLEHRRIQQAAILQNDPFNVEAQRALEEAIREENVEALRQEAMEHMPESFAQGSIVMLYIDVMVNDQRLKAFVDSGAQMTIMSSACAERTGIMRLVDRRFEGMAVGVGTQKIIGRVHMYQLQIGSDFLPTSFSILENQPMDMIIGLDMLKRHRCIIDLQENCLRIGSSGHSTPFLSEAEIPAKDRLEGPPKESGGGGAGPAPTFPDELIARLSKLPSTMGLGSDFPRAQVIEALTVSDGDPDRAASYLIEQASGFT